MAWYAADGTLHQFSVHTECWSGDRKTSCLNNGQYFSPRQNHMDVSRDEAVQTAYTIAVRNFGDRVSARAYVSTWEHSYPAEWNPEFT